MPRKKIEESQIKKSVKRIGGYLKEVTEVLDQSGKVVHQVVQPLMVELRPRDIMQILIGASLLAVPVAFTEESWRLGAILPLKNVLMLSSLGFLFIAGFVYFNFYRFHLKDHFFEYLKRVFAIYFLSLFVAGALLSIIEKCPWGVDNLLALKRVLLVAFPCSMSAAVSDTLK